MNVDIIAWLSHDSVLAIKAVVIINRVARRGKVTFWQSKDSPTNGAP